MTQVKCWMSEKNEECWMSAMEDETECNRYLCVRCLLGDLVKVELGKVYTHFLIENMDTYFNKRGIDLFKIKEVERFKEVVKEYSEYNMDKEQAELDRIDKAWEIRNALFRVLRDWSENNGLEISTKDGKLNIEGIIDQFDYVKEN